ncbi:MAG: hypothetical protein GWN71_32775 [Gammaproteobacteria bacterium]|nr:hypothetical protein [Gemmatimonadota bacterium]NIU78158.1 hypothetical protein [Gammaproteobacteria bacterium]NIX23782.1 hypothetical protein [Actinomycetota bacterium]
MADETLPESPRGRLRWALRESLVIAGVLLGWLALGVALLALGGLLGLTLHVIGLRPLRLVAVVLERSAVLWPAFSAVAFATVALYVVVRAGTLLIDHYRATAG